MKSSDVVVLSALLVGFALLVTAHVTIAAGLARRPPRWRALVAFVVAPLAPYYAAKEKMWVRTFTWLGGVIVYAASAVLARG